MTDYPKKKPNDKQHGDGREKKRRGEIWEFHDSHNAPPQRLYYTYAMFMAWRANLRRPPCFPVIGVGAGTFR